VCKKEVKDPSLIYHVGPNHYVEILGKKYKRLYGLVCLNCKGTIFLLSDNCIELILYNKGHYLIREGELLKIEEWRE